MTLATSVLLYVRPWNVGQMEHLARGVFGSSVVLHKTSEHSRIDGSTFSKRLAKFYHGISLKSQSRHMSEPEIADFILRCRLLRSLDTTTARRLLLAAERAADEVLDATQPTVMLSLTIDSYIMDVFAALCAKRDIHFIGIVPSFVKEHFRISTRGEYVVSRAVSDAEVDEVLATLTVSDYRPDFLVQSEREMLSKMWRLWWRNLPKPLWFKLKRMMPGGNLNYHYWASQIIAQKYWSPLPQTLRGVSGKDLTRLRMDGGLPLIYLPLQMSPEATIDYWSHDARWIDYENFVIGLIKQHKMKWRFVIKEHPNLLGVRSRGFYARLASEQNCVIASPKIVSNDLVELCDAVVVCTGTAGFEAALRGKPVISDSRPYYLPVDEVLPIASLNGNLPAVEMSTERQRSLISYMLRGMLPGRFVNDGTWSINNPSHVSWSNCMAQSIRHYLE